MALKNEDRVQVRVFSGDDTDKVQKRANVFLETLQFHKVLSVLPSQSLASCHSKYGEGDWCFSLTVVYIIRKESGQ